jgi:hypothetical protein
LTRLLKSAAKAALPALQAARATSDTSGLARSEGDRNLQGAGVAALLHCSARYFCRAEGESLKNGCKFRRFGSYGADVAVLLHTAWLGTSAGRRIQDRGWRMLLGLRYKELGR